MIGLVRAIELYLEEDEAERLAQFETVVHEWVDQLGKLHPDVAVTRDFPNEAGQPVPRARLDLIPERTGLSAFAVQHMLMQAEQPVAVAAEFDRYLYLTPDTLEPGEATIVTDAVCRCLLKLGYA